jgi:hypothetical protein
VRRTGRTVQIVAQDCLHQPVQYQAVSRDLSREDEHPGANTAVGDLSQLLPAASASTSLESAVEQILDGSPQP